MIIRAATPGDYPAGRAILVAAFPTAAEADLVDDLRGDSVVVIDLVAELDSTIIGVITCSRMRSPDRSQGLAPLAVMESHRNQGVGAALVRRSLEIARAAGWARMFVLGDPRYYQRFGFVIADQFKSPYSGPAFQTMQLNDGAPDVDKAAYASVFERL